MIQRKRTLQQSGIFLKQNPGEAHLTVDELRAMAASNNSNAFISKISRYVANVAGSNAYWYKVREDLKAIVTTVGTPTIFFTFSSADMHWPDLHALFGNENGTSEERRQAVINNPHIVDRYFTQRLENFIKYWLYKTLDAKWHWYRFEYQARGSIHCHGTAKLNNDPGLCDLMHLSMLSPRVVGSGICGAFDFLCYFSIKFPTVGQQISVKCNQMPHCWAQNIRQTLTTGFQSLHLLNTCYGT